MTTVILRDIDRSQKYVQYGSDSNLELRSQESILQKSRTYDVLVRGCTVMEVFYGVRTAENSRYKGSSMRKNGNYLLMCILCIIKF